MRKVEDVRFGRALYPYVALFVTKLRTRNFHECKIIKHPAVDGDYGRIEARATTVIHNFCWLSKHDAWSELKAAIAVESTSQIADNVTLETHLYHFAAVARRTAEYNSSKPLGESISKFVEAYATGDHSAWDQSV